MPAARTYAVVVATAALFAILAPSRADAALSSAKSRHTHYVNPLEGDYYLTGRTDMGVDFCLRPGEPIRALGDGVVVGISLAWFDQQPYVWYRLTEGRYMGRYVYVAEQIRSLPRIGTRLKAGQPLVYYAGRGTCIEMGWSAATGATLAQATTGYFEGEVTRAGAWFARFLNSLGVRCGSG
jgi:murein DD-endopeptidase MepM/ murein hydrolase activator NlpD